MDNQLTDFSGGQFIEIASTIDTDLDSVVCTASCHKILELDVDKRSVIAVMESGSPQAQVGFSTGGAVGFKEVANYNAGISV